MKLFTADWSMSYMHAITVGVPKCLSLSLLNSYKFKAREFNPRIVSEQGNLGVKPLPRKAVTEPEPFVFESDQRLQQMKKEQSHEEVS